MKKLIYNKLIRDRIPEIIENEGKLCLTRRLSDEEYLKMVDAKLDEELAEYHKDQNLEELADLLEVIYAAAKVRGFSIKELEDVRKSKADKRGAFEQKLFLREVIEYDDEWPLDQEERLAFVNELVSAILEDSEYESSRNKTETEPCVNIYRKGKTATTRDRIAAVWAFETGGLSVLVKKALHDRIEESVRNKGISDAEYKKSEYVYVHVSLAQALDIIKTIAEVTTL